MQRESFRALLYPVLFFGAVAIISMDASTAVAAVFQVDSTNDSLDTHPGDGICADAAGSCTLRAAIREANALPGHDVIELPAGEYALTRSGAGENRSRSGDLDVRDSLTVTGEKAPSESVWIRGDADDGVFELWAECTFQSVNIANGMYGVKAHGLAAVTIVASRIASSDTGIECGSVCNLEQTALNRNGIAVACGSTCDLLAVAIFDSTAVGVEIGPDASAVISRSSIAHNARGISVAEGATVSIDRTGITRNRSSDGAGLAILGNATVTVRNSTFSDNEATHDGGGIWLAGTADSAAIALDAVTLAYNRALNGGGIWAGNARSILVSRSIVAGNAAAAGTDCLGVLESGGYNLVGDTDGCTIEGAADTDLIGANPLLGSLGNNGTAPELATVAESETMALSVDSPAVDAIPVESCGSAVDQRGAVRPQGAGCDIGAYELRKFVATSTLDAADAVPGDAVCDDGAGNCTLRAAFDETNALLGPDVIEVPGGNYVLSSHGGLDASDIALLGAGADSVTIDGAGSVVPVLVLGSGDNVVRGVTIQNGAGNGVEAWENLVIDHSIVRDNAGAGIRACGDVGILGVDHVTVSHNHASGIYVCSDLRAGIAFSTIRDNSMAPPYCGGGLYVGDDSSVEIESTTFSGNEALDGGGLCFGSLVSAHIVNSTISGNRAGRHGGGIVVRRDDSVSQNLNSTTIAENVADSDADGIGDGGGVYFDLADGDVYPQFRNSLIADNVDMGGEVPDCGGPGLYETLGYNLVGSSRGCSAANQMSSDLFDVDPMLESLGSNGGATQTHAVVLGSPALDAIPSCIPADQRGVSRPQGPACDIGAFELEVCEPACDETCARCRQGQCVSSCANPVDSAASDITVIDALFVLRTALGFETCAPCICDVNQDGNVSSADALSILRFLILSTAQPTCALAEIAGRR